MKQQKGVAMLLSLLIVILACAPIVNAQEAGTSGDGQNLTDKEVLPMSTLLQNRGDIATDNSSLAPQIVPKDTPVAMATVADIQSAKGKQIRGEMSVVALDKRSPSQRTFPNGTRMVQGTRMTTDEVEPDYYFWADQPISITSRIYNYNTGQGLPGVYYQFQRSEDGSSWESIGDGYTDQDGYAYLPYYTEHDPGFVYYRTEFYWNPHFILPIGTVYWVPTIPSFTGNPTSGTVPLEVQFSDDSFGPTVVAWQWNFGDGSAGSTSQNPTHTYSAPGNYTVALTITTDYGTYSSTVTNYIHANPVLAPVADFTGSPTSGTAPMSVQFTDQSVNVPTSWSWMFGDGATSTLQNPSHQYGSPGTYTVNHSATNAGGTSWANKTSYVTVSAPTLTAAIRDSADESAITTANVSLYDWVATTTTYTNASTGSAFWLGLSYGNVYRIHASAPGYQSYAENYTHPGGNPTTTVLMEREEDLVANFTGSPLSGTAPLNVQFTDLSTGTPTSWDWDFDNDGTVDSHDQNPVHLYSSAGMYSVNLNITNAGGSNQTIRSGFVFVYPNSPLSYNYDISDLSAPSASTAAGFQTQMGYDSDSVTDGGAHSAYGHMYKNAGGQPAAIFSFNGHGIVDDNGIEGGAIKFRNGSIITAQYSNTSFGFWSVGDIGNTPGENADNLLLVVYVACYSAKDSSTYGNLVTETRSKGARNVIGFTGEIKNQKSNAWADSFWDRTKNGQSIGDAAIDSWHEQCGVQTPPLYLNCGGLDSIVISGDDPANTYLQPARYGTT